MSDKTRSDRPESFSAESSVPESGKFATPSDSAPVKVRLGTWFCESFIFTRRYFWRLFLLAFVLSLLFLGLTPPGFFRKGCCGGSCTVGKSFNGMPYVNALYAESSPAGEEIASETDAGENGAESNTESSTEKSFKNAGETASAEPSAGPPAPRPLFYSSPVSRHAESRFSPFLTPYTVRLFSCVFLIVLFAWMILGWGLRTARQDNASWKNLLFPSRFTLVKLICVSFFVSVLHRLVCLAVFGPLALAGETLAIIAALVVLPFLYAKFGLSWHLVLDRDLGPVRAIKSSWKLTRGNTLALVVGGGSVLLVFLACFVCFSQLFTRFFGSWYGRALFDSLGVLPSMCLFRRMMFPFDVLIGTAAVMTIVSASAVFYLTVTGQPRLGTARRDNT